MVVVNSGFEIKTNKFGKSEIDGLKMDESVDIC